MRAAAFVATLLISATAHAQPAPSAEEAVPGEVRGVRVWLHSSADDALVKLYLQDVVGGRDAWVLVCPQACRVVLPRRAKVRTTFASSEPHDFELEETGRDVEIDVRGPSRAALAGGIVMVSIGSFTALVGGILFGVGVDSDEGSSERTAGLVTLFIGGGLTIGGAILIGNRSKETRIEQFGAKSSFGPKLAEERLFPAAHSAFSWGFAF